MLTQFKPHVRDILVQTLERGIQAIKAGKIGEAADLGVFVRSIPIALESRLEGFEGYKDSFLEEFSMAIDGSFINPELSEFLTGFKEADTDGDADADANAGNDDDDDLDEMNATANAIANGRLLSDEDLRRMGVLETTQA